MAVILVDPPQMGGIGVKPGKAFTTEPAVVVLPNLVLALLGLANQGQLLHLKTLLKLGFSSVPVTHTGLWCYIAGTLV